ncbi:MAG: methyl-accepting chemotaxis protein [Anaerovoracaceae bacterium]
MKTTIRARILKLSGMTILGACLILTAVAAAGMFWISQNDGARLGNHAVESFSSALEGEIEYIGECLADAEPSEDGDTTFNRIFMYGSDTSYDFHGTESIIENAEEGKAVLTPPVENEEGERVLLAVERRSDGIVVGELEYDYLSSYTGLLNQSELDTGFVVNRQGQLLLGVTYEDTICDVNIADYGLQGIIESAAQSESGELVLKGEPLNGAKAMYSYTNIGDTGYIAIYANNYNELMASFYLMVAAMTVIMLACLTVGIVTGVKVSKKIVLPITEVTERLVKFSEGDLHTEFYENDRGDETQILSEALAKTIDAISNYIRDIHWVLSEIGSGNLMVHSEVEYEGDFAEIKNALRDIRTALRTVIRDINSAGGEVLKGSLQLSESSQALAENAMTEAATLQEINSMAGDIKEKIGTTTEKTQNAAVLLDDVVRSTHDGNRIMEEMNEAMNDINKASEEIQKVVGLIEDIAFQTNILALNAAVEAARAGEAGKGFAVVADEVRNLAAKSAEAAQNTMNLIGKSSEAVARGMVLTNDTNESLNSISSAVDQFSSIMTDISNASGEQAAAVEQMTDGLDQITGVIQTNSASAEESAASSHHLKSQADMLNSRVAEFKLD